MSLPSISGIFGGGNKAPKRIEFVKYDGMVYMKRGVFTDVPRVDESKSFNITTVEAQFKSIIKDRNIMVGLLNAAYQRAGSDQKVLAEKHESWDTVKTKGQAHIKTEFDNYVTERDNLMNVLGQLVEQNPELQNAVDNGQGAAVLAGPAAAGGGAGPRAFGGAAPADLVEAAGVGGEDAEVGAAEVLDDKQTEHAAADLASDVVSDALNQTQDAAAQRGAAASGTRVSGAHHLDASEEEEEEESEEEESEEEEEGSDTAASRSSGHEGGPSEGVAAPVNDGESGPAIQHSVGEGVEPAQRPDEVTVHNVAVTLGDFLTAYNNDVIRAVRSLVRFASAMSTMVGARNVNTTYDTCLSYVQFLRSLRKYFTPHLRTVDCEAIEKALRGLIDNEVNVKAGLTRTKNQLQQAGVEVTRLKSILAGIAGELQCGDDVVFARAKEMKTQMKDLYEFAPNRFKNVAHQSVNVYDWNQDYEAQEQFIDFMLSYFPPVDVDGDRIHDLGRRVQFHLEELLSVCKQVKTVHNMHEALDVVKALVHSHSKPAIPVSGVSVEDGLRLQIADLRRDNAQLRRDVQFRDDQIATLTSGSHSAAAHTTSAVHEYDARLMHLLNQVRGLVQQNHARIPTTGSDERMNTLERHISSCFPDPDRPQFMARLIEMLARNNSYLVTITTNHQPGEVRYVDDPDAWETSNVGSDPPFSRSRAGGSRTDVGRRPPASGGRTDASVVTGHRSSTAREGSHAHSSVRSSDSKKTGERDVKEFSSSDASGSASDEEGSEIVMEPEQRAVSNRHRTDEALAVADSLSASKSSAPDRSKSDDAAALARRQPDGGVGFGGSSVAVPFDAASAGMASPQGTQRSETRTPAASTGMASPPGMQRSATRTPAAQGPPKATLTPRADGESRLHEPGHEPVQQVVTEPGAQAPARPAAPASKDQEKQVQGGGAVTVPMTPASAVPPASASVPLPDKGGGAKEKGEADSMTGFGIKSTFRKGWHALTGGKDALVDDDVSLQSESTLDSQ